MFREFLLSVFLGSSLLTFPASADLMDISVGGSVGATESIVGVGPGTVCTPSASGSLSFSQSMTQLGLGSYVLNSSGQESCMPTGGVGSPVSATGQQTAEVTANSVSVISVINGSINNLSLGSPAFLELTPNSTAGLSFDIAAPTIMDLTASAIIQCAGFIMDCFDAPLNGQTGSLDINGSITRYDNSIHTVMTLEPGFYSIEDMESNFAGTSALAGVVSTMSFSANFTPIPEPRGHIALVAISAILICGVNVRRRPQARH